MEGLGDRPVSSALKLYVAVKREVEADPSIQEHIDCLNESEYSDTTPCLAWDLLYQDRGWASRRTPSRYVHPGKVPCQPHHDEQPLPRSSWEERRSTSRRSTSSPTSRSPRTTCSWCTAGSSGWSRPFCTQWTLRPKALAIVNENAHMMDARMAYGPMTLASRAEEHPGDDPRGPGELRPVPWNGLQARRRASKGEGRTGHHEGVLPLLRLLTGKHVVDMRTRVDLDEEYPTCPGGPLKGKSSESMTTK